MDRRDVGVHVPAVLHRLDDGGEVVVGEDHGGGVLGHLGAGDAHGHADVRLLQGGGVVDAVAGHGHQGALLLPGADDADLMLRGHPGIDGDFGDELLAVPPRSSFPPRRLPRPRCRG